MKNTEVFDERFDLLMDARDMYDHVTRTQKFNKGAAVNEAAYDGETHLIQEVLQDGGFVDVALLGSIPVRAMGTYLREQPGRRTVVEIDFVLEGSGIAQKGDDQSRLLDNCLFDVERIAPFVFVDMTPEPLPHSRFLGALTLVDMQLSPRFLFGDRFEGDMDLFEKLTSTSEAPELGDERALAIIADNPFSTLSSLPEPDDFLSLLDR